MVTREERDAAVEAAKPKPRQIVMVVSDIKSGFTAQLMKIVTQGDENGREVHLLIACRGGDVKEALTAYSALKVSKIPIVTHNLCFVESAATLVYVAAARTRRFVSTEESTFMFHGTSHQTVDGELLNVHWLERTLNDVKSLDERGDAILLSESEIPKDKLDAALTVNWTVSAQDALLYKLASKIKPFSRRHRIDPVHIIDSNDSNGIRWSR